MSCATPREKDLFQTGKLGHFKEKYSISPGYDSKVLETAVHGR
jgi:hypothetical protein